MELCHATVGQVIKGKDSQSALQLNCSGMKNIKNNRVQSPSKFFVVEDLKGYNPATDGALSRTSDAKIKNQIRLAMEVRIPLICSMNLHHVKYSSSSSSFQYHELMLEICYYANKAFESQIFCSIMVSFLVTLFCLYGALYTVSNPIPGREDSEIIILLFFVREIVVHAIPALILVHICGKILKKADEVERIVYKMIRYNTNENLQSIVTKTVGHLIKH